MPDSQDPRPGQTPAGSIDAQVTAAPVPEEQRQRRMRALSHGMDLYLHIEDLSHEWMTSVVGPDLSRDEAVLALVAGLKGALLQDEQTC